MGSARRTFLFVGISGAFATAIAIGCNGAEPNEGTPEGGSPSPTPSATTPVPTVDASNGTTCSRIASLCAPYDLGPGAPRDCKDLGRAADEAACVAKEDACLQTCTASAEARLPVTIAFRAAMGAEPFGCGKTYANVGAEGSSVTPVDFRAYVQDVNVFDESGKPVPVKLDVVSPWQNASVALLDFEDGTGACKNGTAETNTVLKGTVPFGKYTGVAFTVGVPAAMNHLAVDEAPSPANLTSMYWGWLYGHIFLATGVRTVAPSDAGADTDADADAGDASAFVPNEFYFHVGSIDCAGAPEDGGAVDCTRPNRPTYAFPAFVPGTGTIVADLKAVLAKSKLQSTKMGCHSFGEEQCLWPFEYAGLNWATGSRTPTTQAFFRLQ